MTDLIIYLCLVGIIYTLLDWGLSVNKSKEGWMNWDEYKDKKERKDE